jgi:hypothetical protein
VLALLPLLILLLEWLRGGWLVELAAAAAVAVLLLPLQLLLQAVL